MFIKNTIQEDNLEKVDQLHALAEANSLTLPELALAWVLRQPNVASALIGASKPEQIEANVKAVDVELDDQILAEIDRILEG